MIQLAEKAQLCEQLHGEHGEHGEHIIHLRNLQQALENAKAEISTLLRLNRRLQHQANNLYEDYSRKLNDDLTSEIVQSVERKSKARKQLLGLCLRLMRTVKKFHPEGPFPAVKFELKDPQTYFRGVDMPENDGGYEVAMIAQWLGKMFELVEQRGWMHEQVSGGAQAITDSSKAAKNGIISSLEEFRQDILCELEVFESTWSPRRIMKNNSKALATNC